jgi:hypothetical protein
LLEAVAIVPTTNGTRTPVKKLVLRETEEPRASPSRSRREKSPTPLFDKPTNNGTTSTRSRGATAAINYSDMFEDDSDDGEQQRKQRKRKAVRAK